MAPSSSRDTAGNEEITVYLVNIAISVVHINGPRKSPHLTQQRVTFLWRITHIHGNMCWIPVPCFRDTITAIPIFCPSLKKFGSHTLKASKLYQFKFFLLIWCYLALATPPPHTHFLSILRHLSHQSSSLCSHFCLIDSFVNLKHTSLILPLKIWVPVTSRSRCPTALLTDTGRERERKETGVDRGEDEADGSRGSYK